MAISTIPTLEAIRETLIPLGYDIIPITHLRIIEAHSQELFDLESKGLIVGQEKLLRAELEKLTEKVEKLRKLVEDGNDESQISITPAQTVKSSADNVIPPTATGRGRPPPRLGTGFERI